MLSESTLDEAATGHVVPLDNPVVTPLPQGVRLAISLSGFSSGPVVRSMSTCGHDPAIQVGDVHRVVTVVHRRDAGRHRDRRCEERYSQICCVTGFAVRVAASMCPWWPGREDGVAVDDALRREP